MFSLQRFLGNDPKFFDLLENSAREAVTCAKALRTLLSVATQDQALHEIQQARARNKTCAEQVSEFAVQTFVTVLEREDIEQLAGALYTIPKPMEKFAEHYTILQDLLGSGIEFRQVAMVEEATTTVLEMVSTLREGVQLELVSKLNTKLQTAEADADNLELELLRDLYHQQNNAMRVLVVRELYELLEKAIDRCRDTGNIVLHICHKNS
jgi:uncharacterized protein